MKVTRFVTTPEDIAAELRVPGLFVQKYTLRLGGDRG